MIRKLRGVVLSALVAVGALSVFGPGPVLGVYAGTCGVTDNQHAYVVHTATKRITKLTAYVPYLRDTAVCTGGSGGSSWVMPVNLQGGTIYKVVQVGYGRSGLSGSAPLRFYYTPTEDGSLTAPSQTPPIVGHAYTFTIRITDNGVDSYWQYQVDDNTAGGSQVWTGTAQTFGSYATLSWAGYEVWNVGDQIAGAASTTYIRNIRETYTDGTSAYLTTTTINSGCCSPLVTPPPSYWRWGVGLDANGRSQVWAYTVDH